MTNVILGVLGLFASVALVFLYHRLWKSEERFRLIADNSSDLVMLHDPQGVHIWVSPSAKRILGFDPEELVGHSAYELFHPDDLGRIAGEAHKRSLAGVPDSRVTYRARRKDGTYIWLETLTAPVRGPKGDIMRLITVSRDVTQTVEAENLYRFLIRNLPDTSVLLFDRKYRHLVAEGTMISHTLQPSGMEMKNIWEVFPEDIAGALPPFYRKVFAGKASRTMETFRTRTYEALFLPIRDAAENVKVGMAVFHDVTDKINRVRMLEEHSQDLERSNRDLAQFAHVASHELKAPLRRISSFADVLADELSLQGEVGEYITHITEGVESLNAVIDSLLAYSSVQANETQLEVVDANDVVDHAVKNLTPLLRESKAIISKKGLPTQLLCNPTLLRQLFENLVGNAVKFNTTGRAPRVMLESRRELLDWEFSVTDNGPGLDPRYQDKVFAMFQRIHPEVEGTGIGLALCKKIVAIHRGRIWYEPGTQGVGTSFRFTLPARLGLNA